MREAFTVKDLYKNLEDAIKNGLGDKKILLSSDDEGNEWHECFFGLGNITEPEWLQLPFGVSYEDAEENYVILG